MDNGPTGSFGHNLRVAALSSEVFLHQAKIDIKEGIGFGFGRM
jgi:hypothetical protein